MEHLVALAQSGPGEPWNEGKLVGQKAPLRLKEIWAIRIRLRLAERTRELALFNLAVDSIPLPHGSPSRDYAQSTTCSRVASAPLHICRHGNMRGLSING
jgi:hypothetical protein